MKISIGSSLRLGEKQYMTSPTDSQHHARQKLRWNGSIPVLANFVSRGPGRHKQTCIRGCVPPDHNRELPICSVYRGDNIWVFRVEFRPSYYLPKVAIQ